MNILSHYADSIPPPAGIWISLGQCLGNVSYLFPSVPVNVHGQYMWTIVDMCFLVSYKIYNEYK